MGRYFSVGVYLIFLEDSQPQAILKIHHLSSLDCRACHRLLFFLYSCSNSELLLATLFQKHNFGCIAPSNLKFTISFLKGILLNSFV